ncbi:indole-3-glycerol-phosphate synthase [Ferroplasma acidiphilum]|jgi:indole-3-glycerol phosphate synthase|uniref:indole-3-glycerol-phosphate synthase n=1 Tax=Ferroplasma acidiphilum TaxID=74969 RepID=A0A7K4FKI5_9ARCH|nr:indole-3-glycerol-phosphate synthase [Ferroplasma acidiphilum]NOL59552.1 indole-3-glycerol-phosphate synthase [Ferroplasma acidiphilum]WMT52934.1 MAG: indole-3-glycerol-phosphate synthase [Ferroplasma acidiphilum]
MIVDEIYSKNNERKLQEFNMRERGIISLKRTLEKNQNGPGIIAEYKRKSPSGFSNKYNTDILKYFDGIQRIIAGISILTEPQYFGGTPLDAEAVQCYNKPILIKDFISSESMIKSSYMSGGDAFLLICDFLDYASIKKLVQYGKKFGMDALVEVHDPASAKNIFPDENVILGYNRRNLKTLKMEDNSEEMYDNLKSYGLPVVLESGINHENINKLHIEKYQGLLIGSSLLSGDTIRW